MTLRTVTMQLPENLYLRLQQTAQATRQSFEAILLTTVTLNMNNPVILDARRRWVSVGWHPPTYSRRSNDVS